MVFGFGANLNIKIVSVLVPLGLFVFALAFLANRAGSREFCSGQRKCRLTRIVIEGQDRQVTLSDDKSLSYIGSVQRLIPLPADIQFTNSLTFSAQLYDRWGGVGTVSMLIGKDLRIIELIDNASSDELHSYIVISNGAPKALQDKLTFLLSEDNRGKRW